jgi:hypothetical protein
MRLFRPSLYSRLAMAPRHAAGSGTRHLLDEYSANRVLQSARTGESTVTATLEHCVSMATKTAPLRAQRRNEAHNALVQELEALLGYSALRTRGRFFPDNLITIATYSVCVGAVSQAGIFAALQTSVVAGPHWPLASLDHALMLGGSLGLLLSYPLAYAVAGAIRVPDVEHLRTRAHTLDNYLKLVAVEERSRHRE